MEVVELGDHGGRQGQALGQEVLYVESEPFGRADVREDSLAERCADLMRECT